MFIVVKCSKLLVALSAALLHVHTSVEVNLLSLEKVSNNTSNDNVMTDTSIDALSYGVLGNEVYYATIANGTCRIYDRQSSLVGNISIPLYPSTLVLKDPLKLFTSAETTMDISISTLQYNSNLMTASQTSTLPTSPVYILFSLDIPNSTYLLLSSNSSCAYLDTSSPLSTFSTSKLVTFSPYPSSVDSLDLVSSNFLLESHDAIAIGFKSGSIPILKRQDLSVLRNPSLSIEEVVHSQIDNINENRYVYFSTSKTTYKLEIPQSSQIDAPLLAVDSTPNIDYTETNRLINMGSLQYLVTITRLVEPSTIVVMSKLTIDRKLKVYDARMQIENSVIIFAGFFRSESYYRFATINKIGPSSVELQSYSIIVDTCTSIGCINCTGDNSKCRECNITEGYYLWTHGYACMDRSSFTDGYGFDNSSLTFEKCSLPNCYNCTNNYEICTQCDTAKGYILDNGTCTLMDRGLYKLKSKAYDLKKSLLSIKFLGSISKDREVLDSLYAVITNTYGEEIARLSKEQAVFTYDGDGFSVKLRVDTTVLSANLNVYSQGSLPIWNEQMTHKYGSYPIETLDLTIISSGGSLLSGAEAVAFTIGAISSSSTIAIIASNPAAAILINKLLSTLLYQTLLNGPYLAYPQILFQSAKYINILPIKFKNPFENLVANDEYCEVDPYLQKNDIQCNILYNYGQDTIVIYCTLLINLIISIVTRPFIKTAPPSKVEKIIEKAKEKPELSSEVALPPAPSARIRLLTWLNENYGLRYFLVSMEGIQLELLMYSYINILSYNHKSIWINLSALVSASWIAYYSTVTICVYSLSHNAWNQLLSHRLDGQSTTDAQPKSKIDKEPATIGEVTDLRAMPFGTLDFYLQDLKLPQKRSELNYAILGFVRTVSLVVAVAGLIGSPWSQLKSTLIIECVYLYFVWIYRMKASRLELIVDIASTMLNVSFILVKLVAFFEMSENTRQNVIGMLAVMCILLNLLINTVYVLYSMIMLLKDGAVYLLIKLGLMKKKIDKIEKEAKTVGETEKQVVTMNNSMSIDNLFNESTSNIKGKIDEKVETKQNIVHPISRIFSGNPKIGKIMSSHKSNGPHMK